MKNILERLFTSIVLLLCAMFFVICLIEMISGCGEHYIDSAGKVHVNQCNFFCDAKW